MNNLSGTPFLDSTLFALPVPSCPILDFWRPSGFRTRMLCPPRRYCSVSLIKCDQTDSTWLQGKCKSREHLHIQIGFQLQDPNALNTFRACIVICEGLQNQMLVKQLELFIQHPCVSIRNLEVVHQLNHFWFQGLRRCQGLQMTHGGWNSLDAWAQVPCPELCSLHTSTPRMARKAKTKSSSNSSTLLTSREKKTVFHLFLLVFQGQTDKPMNQTSKSRTPWPAAGWSSQAVQVFVALVVPCQVPQVVELPLNQVGNLPGGIFQALVARKHVFWTKRYEAKLSQSLDMFQTFESTFNPRHTIFLVHISIRTIPWTW